MHVVDRANLVAKIFDVRQQDVMLFLVMTQVCFMLGIRPSI